MTNQHPITPPPELVQEWIDEPQYMTEDQLGKRMNLISMNEVKFREIIDKISQYSADMELAACCEWLTKYRKPILGNDLRYVRRPQPPNLKEQAMLVLHDLPNMDCAHYNVLLRALEQLND